MTAPDENSYDKLPYVSNAFPYTHPDHLAVMARLFGMSPTPARACRVLEIGCASGGNLIPLGMQYPGSTFVGIDLSGRQIAEGQAMVARLGVTNVELRQMNLMDVDASLGKFDYIVSHGVFSWIPRAAQDRMFAVCKENLTPHGVAYISYNTYPGWRMRGMIRDIMVYHASRFTELTVKVQQARAFLDFLARFVPTENNAYGMLLKQEVEILRRSNDSYLAHEHLEEVNEPLYFHQFAERAAGHGLQYLGEAQLHTMLAINFPQQVADTLRTIAPDIIQLEQYMDFLRNRAFRATLLVHQGLPLTRGLDWRAMEGYRVASQLKPQSEKPDMGAGVVEKFRSPNNIGLNTADPIVKMALTVLYERWPAYLPIADLRAEASARLAAIAPAGADAIAARDVELVNTELLRCLAAGLVELRMEPVQLTNTVSERPAASALARLQAERGMLITNQRHEPVSIDEFSRNVLLQLDGTRDQAALVAEMTKLAADKVLMFKQGDETLRDPAAIEQFLRQGVPIALERMAKLGLLVS